eukprot:1381737-Alexandrium_andersonii.AAC.1
MVCSCSSRASFREPRRVEELWGAPKSTGELRRPPESSGERWRALESPTNFWGGSERMFGRLSFSMG